MSSCIVTFEDFSWNISAEKDKTTFTVSTTESKFSLSKIEFKIYFQFICSINWIVNVELKDTLGILSCEKKFLGSYEDQLYLTENELPLSEDFALKCISFLENTSSYDNCPICLDTIKAFEVKTTKCGHYLHEKCCNTLLKNETAPKCPQCRIEIM